MELVKKIANFSLEDADIFRVAISKKNINLISNLKEKFIDQAIENNYSRSDAINYYNLIEKFAGYAFNKSHASSYALISYWMAYLKANYILEFSICYLSRLNGNAKKLNQYITFLNRKTSKY